MSSTLTHIRDQRPLAHDAEQLLALLRAAEHLVSQQVAAGQVTVAELGHDVVTLSPLTRPGAAYVTVITRVVTMMSLPMIHTIGRDILR